MMQGSSYYEDCGIFEIGYYFVKQNNREYKS